MFAEMSQEDDYKTVKTSLVVCQNEVDEELLVQQESI